jgi:sigma-B regulation protein RsbU (phosphoserine phosphatase)
VQLSPGDAIFLYTDGVTEAENSKEDEFSEASLQSVLEGVRASSVEEIVREVFAEVRTFSAGAPQHDDITAMALRYEGA